MRCLGDLKTLSRQITFFEERLNIKSSENVSQYIRYDYVLCSMLRTKLERTKHRNRNFTAPNLLNVDYFETSEGSLSSFGGSIKGPFQGLRPQT